MANIKKEINPLIKPIIEICERDGDEFFAVYFSREQDAYSGNYTDGMDAGDALIVIEQLISEFNLDRETIAGMR